MTKKIKDFKTAQELKVCYGCEKTFKELSTIQVRLTDSTHKYKGSNRPFIMIYKLKLCPKCFVETKRKVLNIMIVI